MRTKKRMYLCWVLIALFHSLSAQSRIEIKGTDTCAVVPISQMRIANAKFIELKQCREENDSLFSQLRSYSGMTNNLKASILELKQANTLSKQIIDDKQRIIDISNNQLQTAARKQKILKIERNSVILACVALIGKILLF